MHRVKMIAFLLTILFTLAPAAGFAQDGIFDTKAASEHIDKGFELLKAKKYDAAIKEFEAAAAINPEAESYYLLGYTYYLKGKQGDRESRKKARENFKMAYELDPGFSPHRPRLVETITPEDIKKDMYGKTSAEKTPVAEQDAVPKSEEAAERGKKISEEPGVGGAEHIAAPARSLDRPRNARGLTGLMIMDSAFTIPRGRFGVNASVVYEKSTTPGYSVLDVPITATYGVTDCIELGVKAHYLDFSTTTPSLSKKGPGDTEISVKWRWNTQGSLFPEFAVGAAGILPTGSESKDLNEVTHWGMKVLAMASSEIRTSGTSFVGLYAEAQAVFIDKFSGGRKTPTADKYGVLNAGVLLPISPGNRLQGMLEWNKVLYKDTVAGSVPAVNETGITPGLRYVGDRAHITLGAQFLSKDRNGFDNTIRWIATCGYTF